MVQKVRTNAEYQAITRHLDEVGLSYSVEPPTGKGHPALAITLTDGRVVHYTIACTPRGRLNAKSRVAQIKRFLAERAAQSA